MSVLLEDLVERGLDPKRRQLFVINGSNLSRRQARSLSAAGRRCRVASTIGALFQSEREADERARRGRGPRDSPADRGGQLAEGRAGGDTRQRGEFCAKHVGESPLWIRSSARERKSGIRRRSADKPESEVIGVLRGDSSGQRSVLCSLGRKGEDPVSEG